MRKILFFILLLTSLLACDKLEKSIQFSVQTKTTFEVPADASVQTPIVLDAKTLELDSKIFEDFNTSIDLIDRATIKEIRLNIIDPQNANFDFLTDTELYIESDNLPKIRVAWLNNINDDNIQTLVLEHLQDNLSGYLKSDSLKISMVLLTDEVLTQPVQIEVAASFLIEAEKLKK